jgi:hypothetical protein
MKRVLLFVLFITFFGTAAQDVTKNALSMSVGRSLPQGDFGRPNITDEAIGFAQPGMALDFKYNRFFSDSYLGWQLLLRGQQFSNNTEGMANTSAALREGSDWRVQSDNWLIGSMMLGLTTEIPLNDYAYFNMHASVGQSIIRFPSYSVVVLNAAGASVFTFSSETQHGFAYLLGAGLNVEVKPKLFFLLNVDYQAADYNFSSNSRQIGFSALTLSTGLAAKF